MRGGQEERKGFQRGACRILTGNGAGRRGGNAGPLRYRHHRPYLHAPPLPDAPPPLEAARIVRGGGVLVYPTETVYGIGCNPFREEAVARVRAVKGRDAAKPMLAVTDRWDRVAGWFAEVPPPLARLMAHDPPLPVTLVLPAAAEAPPALVSAEGAVAVRRTDDPFVRGLVEAAGMAVLSTSANQAGEPPAARFEDLDPAVLAAVDLAVDAGRPLGGVPSTVVAERGGGLVVLREGAVPRAELERIAGGG